MFGGDAGMGETSGVTSGCEAGTNGAQLRLALVMAAIFLLVLVLITIGNAESMMSDFAAASVPVSPWQIWTWEVTSIIAWLSVTPLIWWAVARLRPPRLSWPTIAILLVMGAVLASAWHIGLMIGLRQIVYAIAGERYHFAGAIRNPYLYEFRKDIPTYVEFVALAALCQWLLARVGDHLPMPELPKGRFLAVGDGAVTHQVPIDDILLVTAAGNYVEIELGGRTLLHRATLAGIEAELGGRFVRIHRSRLVNRDAIRRIETNQSGDFELVLADGRSVKGSRRYRGEVEEGL
jgi:DNA-binding LytR/AlgR family response regulator